MIQKSMKTYYFSIIIFLAFLIFSCDRSRPKQTVQKVDSTSDQSTQNHDSSHDYLKLGFELMHSESIGGLRLGLNTTDLEAKIGTPNEKTAPTYYGADGLNHQTYKYTSMGLEFDLVQKPDSSYMVNMITILTPCDFKTLKGIGINSDIESVKKEYQNYIDPKFSDDKSIVAGSIYGGIIFTIKDQKVKTIFIGQSAE
jgi:hypothetical protein